MRRSLINGVLKMKAYSAGLMSQSFWFIEFKKIVKLVSDGKSQNDIKAACVEENLLGAVNPYRAKRVAGYLTNRVSVLDAREIQMFIESDLATQKLLNLIAVLRTDRLLFEFLFEVYSEKILLGIPVIEDSDTNVFFKNKGAQSNSVEGWKESTKSHLRQCYFNYMADANLLVQDGKTRRITPPVLDIALERHLEAKGEGAMIKAITGGI